MTGSSLGKPGKPGHDGQRHAAVNANGNGRVVSDRRQRQQAVARDHRCMVRTLHPLHRRPERGTHREPVDHLDPFGAAALHVVAVRQDGERFRLVLDLVKEPLSHSWLTNPKRGP